MADNVFDKISEIRRLRGVVARRECRLAELRAYLAALEGADMNAAQQGINLVSMPAPRARRRSLRIPAAKPEESKT
jgi:hypothetical protein